MAKLYFYYAAMNAGKSTTLLQADFNYRERGMETMLWTAASTTARARASSARASRCRRPRTLMMTSVDLFAAVADELKRRKLDCILVDEAQFLSQRHVLQLCGVATTSAFPVLCYGLRTDFQGKLFPGRPPCSRSRTRVELKAVCECGRKATMNLRVDEEGEAVAAGAQTEIGGNDRYVALCRSHFFERLREGESPAVSLGLPRR